MAVIIVLAVRINMQHLVIYANNVVGISGTCQRPVNAYHIIRFTTYRIENGKVPPIRCAAPARECKIIKKEINVGGLRYSEGERKLTDLVAVDDQDIANFKEIDERGVELEFRMLPRDKKKVLKDIL